MKIWIVKRKGKTWSANMMHNLTFQIDRTEFTAQYAFYRKKDAILYRDREYAKHREYFEVVSAEIAFSKEDNRKA
jgi:hypothetical protein